MPLSAPRPLDALRQHTRAVILTADGCELSDDLRELAAGSGVRCEFVDDPLMAVAALTVIEREAKSPERAALVVAERQIDDLGGLFATIRSRLQRVAIWVFEADIAIEVQRGQGAAPVEFADLTQRESAPRSIGTTAPNLTAPNLTPPNLTAPSLRITRPADPPEAPRNSPAPVDADLAETPEDPPGPSGNAVTAEELEMLLDFFDRDQPPRRDDGGPR